MGAAVTDRCYSPLTQERAFTGTRVKKEGQARLFSEFKVSGEVANLRVQAAKARAVGVQTTLAHRRDGFPCADDDLPECIHVGLRGFKLGVELSSSGGVHSDSEAEPVVGLHKLGSLHGLLQASRSDNDSLESRIPRSCKDSVEIRAVLGLSVVHSGEAFVRQVCANVHIPAA